MAHFYRGRDLGQALMAEGLCPANATNVELHIPATGGVTLVYCVNVSDEDVAKLQRALGALLVPKAKESGA